MTTAFQHSCASHLSYYSATVLQSYQEQLFIKLSIWSVTMIGTNTFLCQFCPWLWLELVPQTTRSLIIIFFFFYKMPPCIFPLAWQQSTRLTSSADLHYREGPENWHQTHLSCFMIPLVCCAHTHRFIFSKNRPWKTSSVWNNPMNRLLNLQSSKCKRPGGLERSWCSDLKN